MTEERSHTDTDGVADPLVSRTYRESAAESTPPALDQAVLREARQAGENRYSRSIMWLRPMAWATTIGLCLAIVVELSDLPQPESALMSIPASPSDAIGLKGQLDELIEPKTDEEARIEPEKLEQRARKTIDEDGRVNLQSVHQLTKSAAEQEDNLPAAAFAPDAAPARAVEADIGAKRQVTDTGGFAETDSFERNDSPIIEEADALARMPEGKNKESDDKASAVSSLGLAASASIATVCDEEAQSTPETWIECIEALEHDGLDELAGQQREQLQEIFPDFPMP